MNNSRAQGLSYRDRSHLSSTPEPSWRSNSNTPAGSGRSSPKVSNPSGHRYVDDLEGQNDEALEGLTGKVKLLKELSIGIGQEVRESAVQLTHMNDAFAETGTILSGTFRRMNSMATRQGGRWAKTLGRFPSCSTSSGYKPTQLRLLQLTKEKRMFGYISWNPKVGGVGHIRGKAGQQGRRGPKEGRKDHREQRVVHVDLRPPNIMIKAEGNGE
ncbi:hypothetical protein FRC15_002675 [Serendipita sp. 397]|nr:hypothetical protein FRC15_002675 [Serendipita sp. 397]